MKTIIKTSFVFALLLSVTVGKLMASHSMGADLNYVCLGNDSFLVRYNFYRDCGGIQAPSTVNVNITSSSCGVSNTYTLPLAASTLSFPNPIELAVLCPAQASMTTCNSGTIPGVELYVYEDVIAFATQCSDYVISHSLCCRNDSITNLANPETYDLYVEATLDNTGGICNSSPVFNQKTFFVCAGQQANLNISAFDPDGDSLQFVSINPLDDGGPIPYVAPFSPSQPLSTLSSFSFDSQSGQMSFTPSTTGAAVITVQVNEFRNGIPIGSTMYDIQVVVFNCTNTNPEISEIQGYTGSTLIDSVTISTCPGQNMSFSFSVIDFNVLDSVTLSAPNFAANFPGAQFISIGSGSTLTGNFLWTTAGANTGVHYLTILAEDNACPIIGKTTKVFKIIVIPGTDAGDERYYCPAGGPVQLFATGGTIFSWGPSAGLSNDSIPNPVASPSATTVYTVTSNLTSGCDNTDSVTVNVVPDFTMQVSADDTICENGSTQLQVSTGPQGTPYTYAWSPTSSLTNSSISDPIASPLITTTYTVTVTSSSGCIQHDTATVFVSGLAPRVEITSDRNNVCPGDSIQLLTEIFSLECGPATQGCSPQNPAASKTFGKANASTHFATPFKGTSEDSRFQILYRASELLSSGITSGTITGISLEVGDKTSTADYQNLTLRIGCTSDDDLNIAQGWIPGGTTVFGPFNYSTVLGANSFAFASPYNWDGVSNLFFEICFDNPDTLSPNGDDQLLTVSTAYVSSMRNYSNLNTGCILTPVFTYSQVPKISFQVCPPTTSQFLFSWSPAALVDHPNILNPKAVIQEATPFTLTVQDTGNACESTGVITLHTDTSYGIEATVDGAICGTGSIPISVTTKGTPPTSALSCGTNGTLCLPNSQTQQVGTNPTSSSDVTPYRGFWDDGRIQILYRASELQAAGINLSSTITGIGFNVTNKASTIPYNGFTIRMGCTSLTTVPSTFVSSASMATVYGPQTYTTTSGWNTHVFSDPYDWDGTSNLLIEICFNNAAFTGYDNIQYSTTTGTTVLWDHADMDIGCNLAFPTAESSRANTRFTFCPAPQGNISIAWSPASTLSNPTIENPIASPTVTTTYHVDYTFLNGCTRHDSVTVVVNSFPFNAFTSNDTTVCNAYDNVQLFASGGNGYQWDSVPGLSCYACQDPIASPPNSSVYGVRVSDTTSGCVDYDSLRITVAEELVILPSKDTIFCIDSSVTLDAGGAFTTYLWNNSQPVRDIEVASGGEYSVTVTTNNLCSSSDTIHIYQDTDCVWPGDANNDGIANNFDILAIGVAYGSTGPLRPNITINWEAQSAPAWTQTLANGADYKHSDCTGNGMIDNDDTLAVSFNYGLTHNKTESLGGQADPALYFVLPNDTAREGDNLIIPVFLGRDSLLINDFYGIAFTVNYDNSLVNTSSFRFDGQSSFAGTLGLNLLAFDKHLLPDSKLDAAITRIDQTTTLGRGQIGTLSFTIRNAIDWNGEFVKELDLDFSGIKVIDEQENDILISAESSKIYIVREEPVGIINEIHQANINFYPNPGSNSISIRSNVPINGVALLNILGKEMFNSERIMVKEYSLNLSEFKNGNYLLKVNVADADFIKKNCCP